MARARKPGSARTSSFSRDNAALFRGKNIALKLSRLPREVHYPENRARPAQVALLDPKSSEAAFRRPHLLNNAQNALTSEYGGDEHRNTHTQYPSEDHSRVKPGITLLPFGLSVVNRSHSACLPAAAELVWERGFAPKVPHPTKFQTCFRKAGTARVLWTSWDCRRLNGQELKGPAPLVGRHWAAALHAGHAPARRPSE